MLSISLKSRYVVPSGLPQKKSVNEVLYPSLYPALLASLLQELIPQWLQLFKHDLHGVDSWGSNSIGPSNIWPEEQY